MIDDCLKLFLFYNNIYFCNAEFSAIDVVVKLVREKILSFVAEFQFYFLTELHILLEACIHTHIFTKIFRKGTKKM